MDFPHLTEDDMAEIKKEVSIHAVDNVFSPKSFNRVFFKLII